MTARKALPKGSKSKGSAKRKPGGGTTAADVMAEVRLRLGKNEWLRSAALALVSAASNVPIVKRGNEKPFSTCLGCGRTDGLPCRRGCWVLRLEHAIDDAKEALR